MSCIEEIINIPELLVRLQKSSEDGHLISILNEITLQSRLEFNLVENESNEV